MSRNHTYTWNQQHLIRDGKPWLPVNENHSFINVEAALADPCCSTNPLPVENFMVRKVLEEVTGRV